MTLVLDAVAVRRGRVPVLREVTASLAPGQIVGIIGPNGTGKSTLLNAIAGLLHWKGRIAWKGGPVDLGAIGDLPQRAEVRAELSVLETVLLGRREALGWRVADATLEGAAAMLDTFGIGALHARGMETLSGGQQQLVLLAQRLLRQPGLVLLDEATSALDIRHQMLVFDRLRGYVARIGALVVIALHDLNLAGLHCDRLVLLHEGRIAAEGLAEDVLTATHLRRVYGIEAEFLRSASGRPVILPRCPAGTGPDAH